MSQRDRSNTPSAPNYGARWTPEQDDWLWRHIARLDVAACSERMGRTIGSIASRLKLLAHRRIHTGTMHMAAAAEHIGVSEAELQEWIDRSLAKEEEARAKKPPAAAPPPLPAPLLHVEGPEVGLSEEQAAIVRDVMDGKSVFMTGVAGTGKTTTIRAVAAALSRAGRSYGITAMTGTAAILLGGQTLHSFLGIGLGTSPPASMAWFTRNRVPKRAQMLQELDVLIIDEVSMMGADLLDRISKYLSILRERDTEPFGGIRLLLSGDMCQLPPIHEAFCFQAASWRLAGCTRHVLSHVYRQENDTVFLGILERARWGALNDTDVATLREACHRVFPEDTGIVPTRLYPLRADVERINQQSFDELVARSGGPEIVARYPAMFGKKGATKEAIKAARAWFEKGRHAMVVEVCPGAQVMATWNLKKDGVMNGTRGVVFRCTPHSVHVRLVNGLVTEIGYQTISPADNPAMEVQFLPLQLAWAMSIHKSQGMTLDCMEVDLGRNVFEYGQAYTALSRARSLEGVRLLDFHPSAFRTHPEVLAFYGR